MLLSLSFVSEPYPVRSSDDRISCYKAHLCSNGAFLTAYLYLLYPIATFQKAGTCLDAQQSMAKQPIKGCVSNHSRTCGKSVSENSE